MSELLEALRTAQPLPPRYAHTYCSQCGCSVGPGNSGVSRCSDHLPESARKVQHYTALAHEAELLHALRSACAVIEASARDSFWRKHMSQVDFELSWRADEPERHEQWEALKSVAGLTLTDLNPPMSWDDA